ncbi:Lysophospholipase L1 [Chitinophaga terrae (ex Kim and Jung 2007)]|uniref:Lysophospholipase L1 n=1 Tax=Chitinophaga terrae (ex Kim and Jung 2007) TaxID=408074 RepID=A0A1H4B9K6_9BACT|nr:SGNH/GDSL hydrolase family protein [Chitinophaga terrae (ex Kim and Jung 2007)]SEA44744.1 Lysophospholipase L1 [Chitinophaga terrae (ex Kim and Jung 2007)]
MKLKKLCLPVMALMLLGSAAWAQNGADSAAIRKKKQEEERMKQDWACLKCFADANAQVAPPAAGENRVVFMGNSITIGWLKTMPEYFNGKPYINRGISGQTTPQMLIRFRPDVINLKPKVVVILAGTNDIAGNTGYTPVETIYGNIVSMAELAKANNIKVVLASVLPAFDYPWRPGLEPVPKIAELNNKLKQYAESHNLVYLDYYSAMADERKGLKAELTYDGVHPNKAGYEVMAPLAEKAIAQALKRR